MTWKHYIANLLVIPKSEFWELDCGTSMQTGHIN